MSGVTYPNRLLSRQPSRHTSQISNWTRAEFRTKKNRSTVVDRFYRPKRAGAGLHLEGRTVSARVEAVLFERARCEDEQPRLQIDAKNMAANAAQLRRNMEGLNLVLIPSMYWDF